MTPAQISASIQRFAVTMQALAPGCDAGGNPDGTVTINFRPANTQQQRDAANAAALTFDWSQAAQTAWEDSVQEPDWATLRAQATGAVQTNNAYLVIADSATNLQVRDQVKALTQQNTQLIKSLGAVILKLTGR